MKIAYVDTSVDGHHVSYLSALVESNGAESVLILPQMVEMTACRQRIFKNKEPKKRSAKAFWKWIREVSAIVEEEKPDIVHFLYADTFYRFFGLGLHLFKKYRTILTLHWAKDGRLGRLSSKALGKCVDHVVVHSAYIKRYLESCGVKNAVHIEYPCFNRCSATKEEGCKYWSLSEEIPVIACVGHTRPDKGLDILLEALNGVNKPFQLLVAGKEDAFDRAFIEEKAKKYLDRVHLCLRYLSDEEVGYAFAACDIVVLPYRRIFNGASGPLGEGVCNGKCIVGANHGNLGDTISRNHLGYTFETENVAALTCALEQALSGAFFMDDAYLQYRQSLEVGRFTEDYGRLYASAKNAGNEA